MAKDFDGGDDRLLDQLAAELVGRRTVRASKAAVELVDVAEVALEVPEERNLAVIEMCQVDAGAEHVPVLVLRVLDLHRRAALRLRPADRARQDRRSFEAFERGLVFGVQKSRIFIGQDRRLAPPLDRAAGQFDRALLCEFGQQRLRLGLGQQHGVAKMRSRLRAAKDG